jgi:hypothetical protein
LKGSTVRRTIIRTGAAVLAAALVAAIGVAVVSRLHHDRASLPVRANARPSKLPAGPAAEDNVVTSADGSQMRCPSGQLPAITLQNARFAPPLADGHAFAKGRYRIRLTGTAANDTTAPIAITGVVVTVGGHQWRPAVTAPTALRPSTGGDIAIDGTYDSPAPAAASIHAALQWQWQAVMLRPCGVRGLIEDD